MAGPGIVDEDLEGKLQMATAAAARFEYVRFTFSDIHGASRSKTVKRKFLKKYFEEGTTIFISIVGVGLAGEVYVNEFIPRFPNTGSVEMVPVLGTLHEVPSAGAGKWKVGEVLTETRHIASKNWQESCPRYVARKQLEKLTEVGYQLYSGFEAEFQIVDGESLQPVSSHCSGVFYNPTFTENEELIYTIDQNLEAMGVDVEVLQTEYSPGQLEFGMSPQLGLTSADNMFMLRDCVKEVAIKRGKKAIFMTKPSADIPAANGLHFSFSLKNPDGQNVFSDLNKEYGLSDVFYYFLAGVIKHSRALVALSCPTVNCYRRLNRSAAWTPCYANWGLDDRSAAFRVKNSTPSSTYVECRIPSGCANPYLVLAGVVASGVDGIKNKLPCPKPIAYKENVLEVTSDMIKLPSTLKEAVQALNEDDYLVEVLGKEFIHWFSVIKNHEVETLISSNVMSDNDSEENYKAEFDMYSHIL